jgi:hypothetical protein
VKFFVLENTFAADAPYSTDYYTPDDQPVLPAPTCPRCGRFVGSLQLPAPLRVWLEAEGPKWGDLAFGGGDQVLMSRRVLDRLRSVGATGLHVCGPVSITNNLEDSSLGPIPEYSLVSITHSETRLDAERSGFVVDRPMNCGSCRGDAILNSLSRIEVDESTWTREDLFYACNLPGVIIVSETAGRVLSDETFLNVKVIDAHSYRIPRRDWG